MPDLFDFPAVAIDDNRETTDAVNAEGIVGEPDLTTDLAPVRCQRTGDKLDGRVGCRVGRGMHALHCDAGLDEDACIGQGTAGRLVGGTGVALRQVAVYLMTRQPCKAPFGNAPEDWKIG